MKKNEKIVIVILLIVTIALIVVSVVKNNSTEETSSESTVSNVEDEAQNETEGENYRVLDDGTKLNTSSPLHEKKILEGLEITDMQLTETDNVTVLLATITNTSDSTQGGYVATLTLLDEEGNTLLVMEPYINELEPGESTQLNTSAVFDYTNAYDFTIVKK